MSEWKSDLLSNHVTLITKGTTPTSLGKSFQDSGINFIKAESITDEGVFIPGAFAFIDEETHNLLNRSQLLCGDLLFSIAGVLGRVAIVKNEILPANTNQAIAIIRLSPNSEIENDFLKYYLKSDFIIEQVKRINVQAAQANFNLGDINRLQVKYPLEKTEQRRIAHILSTIDSVIEKTQSAIDKYKAIKQGMLHDLFTRGIDIKTGKLRPPYHDAPELYKESKLGWIPKEWHEGTIFTTTYLKGRIGWQGLRADEFIKTGPYLITGTDFINGKINWATCYHISEVRFQESPSIHIKNEDVLITKDGTIGKIAFVTNCPSKAILNSGVFVMRCKDDSYINIYLYFLLTSSLFKNWLNIYQGGSTINHLYQREFEKFLFPIPSVPEQEFITQKFLTIERNINNEEVYLLKLNMLKSGLMSDLLSGKKRVKVDIKDLSKTV